jgi:excisionase family DNA binding protein
MQDGSAGSINGVMSGTTPGNSVGTSPGATTGTYAGVSVVEAAHTLGVSINTVRKWVKTGRLQAERIARPQGVILRVYLPQQHAANEQAPVAPRQGLREDPHEAPAVEPQQTPPLVPDLARASAMAEYNRALVEPLVREIDELSRRLETLASENGRLSAELESARSRLEPQPCPWWRRWRRWATVILA